MNTCLVIVYGVFQNNVTDNKLVGESNSRLARYSSTKIGECMC